jgi:hypothetical protein
MSELLATTRTARISYPASAEIKRAAADLALHTEQLLDSRDYPQQLHGTFVPQEVHDEQKEHVPPLQPLLAIDWQPLGGYAVRAHLPFLADKADSIGLNELRYMAYPSARDRFGWQITRPHHIAQTYWHAEASPPPESIAPEHVLQGVANVLEKLCRDATLESTVTWRIDWEYQWDRQPQPPLFQDEFGMVTPP